jgi:hypothetical protein
MRIDARGLCAGVCARAHRGTFFNHHIALPALREPLEKVRVIFYHRSQGTSEGGESIL